MLRIAHWRSSTWLCGVDSPSSSCVPRSAPTGWSMSAASATTLNFSSDYGHLVEALNDQIAKDGALGRQFCVGHSYFTPAVRLESTGLDTAVWWERVVHTDVRPLLEEYWFDRPDVADAACERLLGA